MCLRQFSSNHFWNAGRAIALAGLLTGQLMAQAPAEPTPAEVPTQAEAAKPKISAKKLLAGAYERTKTAQTIDEFSEVIEQCERALAAKLTEENAAYARQLAGWSYNRRGELYAKDAAALAGDGEERQANDLDELALADFEAAISHDPGKWKALQNRGVSLALRGKLEEALADFAKVLELKPDYPNAWFNQAEIRALQGKWAEAADDYSEALELKPDDVGTLLGRGNALLRLEKPRDALADFQQGLRLEPKNAAALAGRGDAREALGRYAEAAEDYRRAIQLNSKLGKAYRGAAWLMATCPEEEIRNAELAVESARQALNLDTGRDYTYLDTLAAALANAGEFEDAQQTLKKAIQIAPDSATGPLRARLELYTLGKPYRQHAESARGNEAADLRPR